MEYTELETNEKERMTPEQIIIDFLIPLNLEPELL